MKKYILYPGVITSIDDGKTHHITAEVLCRLYGVLMDDCVVLKDGERLKGVDSIKCIHLFPRMDGKYRLPK